MTIDWTKEKLFKLKELTLGGLSSAQTAQRLSLLFNEEFTFKSVIGAKERNRLFYHCIVKDSKVKTYKALTLSMDNYMISCDEHGPYHSEVFLNRKLAIADKFKIKKNIQIGDVLDFDFMSSWPVIDGEKRGELDEEIEQIMPIIKSMDYFDENYLVCGNHERRIGRITDSRIQAEHLYRLIGQEKWREKFKYSTYDKMMIGKDWMVVHPKSYSQVATSVAKRLAEKFHRNIINSHGHLVGMTYDRSGKFMAIDLGGMFEKKKIAYINLSTTVHPSWKNGFGALIDGYFWHFHEGTNWKYWIGS